MSALDLTTTTTAATDPAVLEAVRAVLDEAFENFSDDDWSHAQGGWHVVARSDGVVVAHAAVVHRLLHVGEVAVRTGYVEAVATAPHMQGRGIGSAVMAEAARIIRSSFELGALSTSAHAFYERLGWRRWRGPTSVRDGASLRRTPDEDAGVMVLLVDRAFDTTAPISCEARPGDDW